MMSTVIEAAKVGLYWLLWQALHSCEIGTVNCSCWNIGSVFTRRAIINHRVADPDPNPCPDPPDPHVFGPPGSFHHHAKIVRKTLIPTILCCFFYFLSLKKDVNVPKSNKQKKNKKFVFCWHFENQ
jgi:hypothetical protein